jgi:hypothetical protein
MQKFVREVGKHISMLQGHNIQVMKHYHFKWIDVNLVLLLLLIDWMGCLFSTRAVWKVRGSWTHLITLSQNFVEMRWWSFFQSTFLGKWCTSYDAPPTSRKHAVDHWSLWNFLPQSSLFMVGKAQKSHGARSELNSVFNLEKVDRWEPIRTSTIQSRSHLMRFLGFSNHEKGAPKQEISKWSTVYSTYSRSGWNDVRTALLAKGGTAKKRLLPHLHRVPTQE